MMNFARVAGVVFVLGLAGMGCKSKDTNSGAGSPISTANYTVTTSGANLTITDATSATAGAKAFTVVAATGFSVSSSVGGTCPAGTWSGSTYTTGVLSADCTVVFAAQVKTLTVTPSGSHVTISPNGAQTVNYGTTQAFTANADSSYTLSSTVGGTCPAGSWAGNVYTTGAVTSDCTVSFSASLLYGVNPSGTNVTFSPNALQNVNPNATAAFTVSARTGYTLSSTVSGTCPAGSWASNVYTTGAITGDCSVTFGYDIPTAWAKAAQSGADLNQFNATAVDGSGNVYVVGLIKGNAAFNFGGVSVTGTYATGNNALLIKYNSAGAVQWAKSLIAGASDSAFNAVAVDGNGDVYVAGSIKGTSAYDFGGATATGAYSGDNVVVVKYNSSGAAQWAKTTTSATGSTKYLGVAVDGNGNVYAVGMISGSINYGLGDSVSVQGPAGPSSNVVLAKYDAAAGTTLWARTTTVALGINWFQAVAVDGSGNIYAAGFIYNSYTYTFGAGVSATNGGWQNSPVLVKYDATGTALWAQTISSASSNSEFKAVVVDGSGNVYAGGFLSGSGATYDFGNSVSLSGSGSASAVVVKYNSSGVAQWAEGATYAMSNSAFNALAVDSTNHVYAAGYMTSSFGWMNGALAEGPNGLNAASTVVAKYDSAGAGQLAYSNPTGSAASGHNGIAVHSGSGSIYAAGYVTNTAAFGFGNGKSVTGVYGGWNAVLVKY